MRLHNADDYPVLCDVVGVTICNFNLWPEQDDRGRFKVPMLSRWRRQEQHIGERGLSQVQYVFLELPKYTAGDAPRTLIDRWAYFFREATNLTVVPRGAIQGRARGCPNGYLLARGVGRAGEDGRAGCSGVLTVARQEGCAEGHRSGLVKGKRDALLRVLAQRGFTLTEDARMRIAACVEIAVLDQWFENALSAKTVADVLS